MPILRFVSTDECASRNSTKALPSVTQGETEARREGRNLVAETEFFSVDDGLISIDRSAVRITVLGKNHAVDIKGCTTG